MTAVCIFSSITPRSVHKMHSGAQRCIAQTSFSEAAHYESGQISSQENTVSYFIMKLVQHFFTPFRVDLSHHERDFVVMCLHSTVS